MIKFKLSVIIFILGFFLYSGITPECVRAQDFGGGYEEKLNVAAGLTPSGHTVGDPVAGDDDDDDERPGLLDGLFKLTCLLGTVTEATVELSSIPLECMDAVAGGNP